MNFWGTGCATPFFSLRQPSKPYRPRWRPRPMVLRRRVFTPPLLLSVMNSLYLIREVKSIAGDGFTDNHVSAAMLFRVNALTKPGLTRRIAAIMREGTP